MSTLSSMGWKPAARNATVVPAITPSDSAEPSAMHQSAVILRDTLIVLAIQLVFRATLAMRRWNY
ncbi:MAG: hypothetical protein WAN14_13955 [Candidatus Acidiferrales bacterium]